MTLGRITSLLLCLLLVPALTRADPIHGTPDFSGTFVTVSALGTRSSFGNSSDFPGTNDAHNRTAGVGVSVGHLWQTRRLSYGVSLSMDRYNSDEGLPCQPTAETCGLSAKETAALQFQIGQTHGARTLLFAAIGPTISDVTAFTQNSTTRRSSTKSVSGHRISLGAEYQLNDTLSLRGAVHHQNFRTENYQADIRYRNVDMETSILDLGIALRF